MDFSLFPFEVIEKIMWYLNRDDIYACLQICEWRDSIDSSSICKKFLTYHPDYFEKQTQRCTLSIENNLELKVSTKECKQLIKEKYVERNFINNKHHLDSILVHSDDFVDNVLDAVDKRGHHWLFVSLISTDPFLGEHKIKVFSVENNLKLSATIPTSRGITSPLLGSSFEFNANDNVDTLCHMHEMSVLVLKFDLKKESITLLKMKLICVSDVWVQSLNLNPDAHYRAAITHIGDKYQVFLNTAYHMNLEIEPSVLIMDDEGHVSQEDSNKNIYQIHLRRFFPVPTITVSRENCLALVCFATQVPNTLRYCIYDAKQKSFSQFNISASHTECYNLRGSTVLIANWVNSSLHMSFYKASNAKITFTKNVNKHCDLHLFSETVLIIGSKKSLSAIDVLKGEVIWEYKIKLDAFLRKFFSLSEKTFALGVQHEYHGQVTYEMWDAIRGYPLGCPFSLGTGLGPLMSASYIRQYQPPPCIVFYTDPESRYSRLDRGCLTSIFVLMYW